MAFLPGDRQLVYVDRHGSLMLQDIGTLARREIIHALPLPHDRDGSITMAPDGRTIYYAAHQIESNIWLVKQAPGTP